MVVLPLPIGPWIKVILFTAAFSTANCYSSFSWVFVPLTLYFSPSASFLIIGVDLLIGEQRVWRIAGWAALESKQIDFKASYILSWVVLENILVIFQFLLRSTLLIVLRSSSLLGDIVLLLSVVIVVVVVFLIFPFNVWLMNNLSLLSFVNSLTVAMIAYSITLPNSVMVWTKSLLSTVLLAR